ncbi:MAG: bifunctional DNA-formamidopyrimidine glycosylase/DNA-(apurinic or apyrimidinic site) lyase [bacterium]
MPELPEVETIRRELAPLLVGRRITAVEVRRPDIVGWPSPAEFSREAVGRRVTGVARRGKYLVIELAGRELVIHLRLSGHLAVRSAAEPPARHERCRFRLSGGRALILVEPRVLGRVYLVRPGAYPAVLKGMLGMGPEPVSPGFTAGFLAGRLAGRRAAVKSLLLDQRVCCGVGNIYSDEALFRAGIRPERPAGSLDADEVRRLAASLRRVTSDGIRWCGTTLGDGRYQRPGSQSGEFQRRLRVYGRAGERCRRRGCRGVIRKVKLGNRGSSYCPVCQR